VKHKNLITNIKNSSDAGSGIRLLYAVRDMPHVAPWQAGGFTADFLISTQEDGSRLGLLPIFPE
jgi:hypothetical protein